MYPCHAVIVSMEVGTGEQQFFMGHTDKVKCHIKAIQIHFLIVFSLSILTSVQ